MLMLVMGENLLVTFLGWEGVGACSYFLISFWHTRNSAAVAGKKAFVTNRIGDFGVMTAMFLAFSAVGSLSYGAINEAAHAGELASVTATAIAMLLFVGACGKSAQLPLYLWLPDAMEGPTPVSALIHAATMVTSGVFLMTRMNPVLHISYDWAPTVIAVVGAATALYAATVAVAQNDIKKVLAYSTVSQLGFMFLAIGSGAYVAAIFHMITHAFFKALLFLGSGSVIHGMHHEQDMRRMGALRKVMPVTGFTFIIGWLAIAGVPPFAGFWSKDEILLYVYANNRGLYVVGLVTALLTAYYMTRQVIMVFYGKARWNDNSAEHGAHGEITPHESPRVMLIPLIVLSVLSILGGAMQLPFSKDLHFLEHWLAPVVEESEAYIGKSWAYQNKYLLLLVAIVVAVSGILISISVYAKSKFKVIEPKILEQAWKYDHAVSRAVGGPGAATFNLIAWIDANIVDGIVNGVGELIRSVAGSVRRVQSGFVRTYALLICFGAVAILAWFLLRGVLL
jgi:NADH-quinone oxidoreductase subunit L